MFKKYVEQGVFPQGVLRGKRLRVWTREDVAVCAYIEANLARFVVGAVPEDGEDAA